jgi:trimeric autotransporter adhesin
MKKITLLLLLLVSSMLYSQKNGITYQAVILNPNDGKVPANSINSPLMNKKICLQFTILDAASKTEYQEIINTTTDGFGMVNTIIGSGIQSAGYASAFVDIYWSTDQKSLKVALDVNGKCSNFIEISNQTFTSVPSAFAALNAENVTGVVSIENGGTNAISVLGAKTNLALENVDNTSDLNKPISLATQIALNQKEVSNNKSVDVTIDGTSDVKYPTAKAVKTYVDASVGSGSLALTTEVSRAIYGCRKFIDYKFGNRSNESYQCRFVKRRFSQ